VADPAGSDHGDVDGRDRPVPRPGGGDRDRPPRRGDGGAPERAGRNTRVTIARREIASLRSEKTIVLALAIQFLIAAFSSFLVVGLVSLYSPGTGGFQPTVAVTGNASDEVRAATVGSQAREDVILRSVPDRAVALDAFESGGFDAVVVANVTPAGEIRATALVPEGNARSTVTVVTVRDLLTTVERERRVQFAETGRIPDPVPVPNRVPASPYFGFTYTVLVPTLVFLPAFISGSVAVDSLTEEVQRGTLELLRVAPVDLSTIVDAKVLSAATLAPAQAALWVVLLEIDGTTIARPVGVVAVVAGLATALVVVGAGIALLAPDRRQAQFLYSSGVLAAALVASLLPEHPANTVAKLAVGSATTGTWLAVVAYVALGAVAYLAVRVAVGRLDPEGL